MLWLEPHLHELSARILEVGCGQGHLAAALAGAGHDVVALDSNEEAVAATRYKGVDARLATFPDNLPERHEDPFDIVLFTRSLHHVEDLDAAAAAAFSLLAPTGIVLVEDWAWNIIDERTAAWAYGLMGIGRTAGLVPQGLWQGGNDPLRHWLDEHEHHVHAIAEMRDAIVKHGKQHNVSITEETTPYFYRYFCDYLANHDDDGAAIVESVLAAEQQMLNAGAMAPLGWRLAATHA